jgi:hypothetical protein
MRISDSNGGSMSAVTSNRYDLPSSLFINTVRRISSSLGGVHAITPHIYDPPQPAFLSNPPPVPLSAVPMR